MRQHSGEEAGWNEQTERNALRLLLSDLIQPATRVELLGLMDEELFVNDLHRVVFKEMRNMGQSTAREMRGLLPARITNRGFPEFDWNEFLGAKVASEKEIEELYASVLRMIEVRHRDDAETEAN
jgi:hypothetical protein